MYHFFTLQIIFSLDAPVIVFAIFRYGRKDCFSLPALWACHALKTLGKYSNELIFFSVHCWGQFFNQGQKKIYRHVSPRDYITSPVFQHSVNLSQVNPSIPKIKVNFIFHVHTLLIPTIKRRFIDHGLDSHNLIDGDHYWGLQWIVCVCFDHN